jgi:hypothetical protein
MSVTFPHNDTARLVQAIELLCNEPPIVASVERLSEVEKQYRRRIYYKEYYEKNKERFKERFKENGANKRYYESNKTIKKDMIGFNVFMKRLEKENEVI